MKYQIIFSGKCKKNISKCPLLKSSMLSVKWSTGNYKTKNQKDNFTFSESRVRSPINKIMIIMRHFGLITTVIGISEAMQMITVKLKTRYKKHFIKADLSWSTC